MKKPPEPQTRSPEQARREQRLGEALRANLRRRKAAARKSSAEIAGEPEPAAGHVPGDDLPGDERG